MGKIANVTVGIVFHANPDDINQIILELKQTYGINPVCIKTSWGKLWIKEGDAP